MVYTDNFTITKMRNLELFTYFAYGHIKDIVHSNGSLPVTVEDLECNETDMKITKFSFPLRINVSGDNTPDWKNQTLSTKKKYSVNSDYFMMLLR